MPNFDIIIKNGTRSMAREMIVFVSEGYINVAKLLKLVSAQIMIQQKI